jgi:hypothetical protein
MLLGKERIQSKLNGKPWSLKSLPTRETPQLMAY